MRAHAKGAVQVDPPLRDLSPRPRLAGPAAALGRALAVLLLLGALGGCLEPFPAQPRLPRTPTSGQRAAAGPDPAKRSAAGSATRDAALAPPAQSEAQAWRLICDAEERAGVDPAAPRGERAGQVAEWIVAHVSNKRARLWWIEFGKLERQHQRRAFLAAASRGGVAQCRLAELLFGATSSLGDASLARDASPHGAAAPVDAGTASRRSAGQAP
ncbi:MAG: hypothetical protein IPL40_07540 [Proteobacteria bacterium]|nr:hypothetical protein [Pseudomonadota bacterium]